MVVVMGVRGNHMVFFCCFCLKNILDSFMHFFWLLKKTTVKTLYSMDFMNENHAWYVIQFSVDVFLFSCLFFRLANQPAKRTNEIKHQQHFLYIFIDLLFFQNKNSYDARFVMFIRGREREKFIINLMIWLAPPFIILPLLFSKSWFLVPK